VLAADRELLVESQIREPTALIESAGWFQVRMRGSHRQFHHSVKSGTAAIAGKPSQDVPPGTLASVMEQAGLKSQE
jgi:predicted RNA binding protein YcfA (HicA-like mRNA interferase family)